MTMTYKNYLIEENENYHVAHPERKYVFSSTTDCDESMGCGRSIEECIEQINERLDF